MHQDDFTDEAQGPLEEMPDVILHANDKTRNVVANDDYLEGEYPEQQWHGHQQMISSINEGSGAISNSRSPQGLSRQGNNSVTEA